MFQKERPTLASSRSAGRFHFWGLDFTLIIRPKVRAPVQTHPPSTHARHFAIYQKSVRRLLHHVAPDVFFFGGYEFTTLYLPKTRVPMQPHPPYAHDRHTVIHQNAPDALLHRTTSGAFFLEIRLQRSHSPQSLRAGANLSAVRSRSSFCHIPKERPTHASSHGAGRVHFWITSHRFAFFQNSPVPTPSGHGKRASASRHVVSLMTASPRSVESARAMPTNCIR